MANFLKVVILKIAQKFWISVIYFLENSRFLHYVSNCLIQVEIVGSRHGRSSIKLAVLKISQNSQENICARASFLKIKLQALKRLSGTGAFLANFAKF